MPQLYDSDIGRLLQVFRGDDDQARQLDLIQAVVVSVDAASGTVPTSLTINFNGTIVPEIRYLDSYVPAADDTVWLLAYGSDVFVIGKLAT